MLQITLKPVKLNSIQKPHNFSYLKKDLECAYSLIKELEDLYSSLPPAVLHLLQLKESYEGLQQTSKNFSFKKVLYDPSNQKFINYKSAIESLSKASKVTKHLVLQTHKTIQKSLKKDAGYIRKAQNWIGPEGCQIKDAYFLPPHASDIEKNIHDLFCYLNKSKDDPLIKLAIFFAQFLIIHPFMDGNGRTIRALVTPLLKQMNVIKKSSLYMSGFFKKNRLKYFETLYDITNQNNLKPWMRFFIKGIIVSLKNQLHFCKQLGTMYNTLLQNKKQIFHFTTSIHKLFYLIYVPTEALNPTSFRNLKNLGWIQGKKQASLKGMPRLIKKIQSSN